MEVFRPLSIKKLLPREIAIICKCHRNTIFNYLHKYDIPTRSVSESKTGSNHPNFGKKRKCNGKRCWYILPDGRTVSMRSQWEVWYAEYLREKKIQFKYEEFTFNLSNGSAYTPDFLLIDSNQYIEVKGFFRPEHI